MKKYVLIAATLFSCIALQAQVSGYRFMHEQGGPMDIEDYPGIVITHHDVQDDFLTPGKVKLTFPFRFGGQLMDSVGVHENGFLFFGRIRPFDIGAFWPISSVHPSSVTGIISALGIDLHPVETPGQTTTIKSGITGTAPMRMFIAQWQGTSRIDALNHPAGPDSINFQIRLYETTNRVEIAYQRFKLNPAITDDVEIGIKGATYDDYSNRVPDNSNWSSSLAGTSQMARKTLSDNSKPEFGTLFVWEVSGGTTGVADLDEESKMTLYPVPAKNKLHIRSSEENTAHTAFTITDLAGRIVQSGRVEDKAVSLETINPGIYTITIEGKKRRISKVFTKH